jgi:hypothetical protein
MEPLKPETKQQILSDRPQASPDDIEEYERLLSERFASDPDERFASDPDALTPPTFGFDDATGREARIRELHEKLFGG